MQVISSKVSLQEKSLHIKNLIQAIRRLILHCRLAGAKYMTNMLFFNILLVFS